MASEHNCIQLHSARRTLLELLHVERGVHETRIINAGQAVGALYEDSQVCTGVGRLERAAALQHRSRDGANLGASLSVGFLEGESVFIQVGLDVKSDAAAGCDGQGGFQMLWTSALFITIDVILTLTSALFSSVHLRTTSRSALWPRALRTRRAA